MKKFISILLLAVTMVACDASKSLSGAYNMINCNYNYRSISGLSISGMNLSGGLSVTNIAKITSLLSGTATSIPMNFTLNMDVNNPNQSAAMFNGMSYILNIDGVQFTTGTVNQTMNIAAGQTQTLPLTIGVDLAQLMKSESKDAVTNIAKNFLGIGSQKSEVNLQIKPTFMIGNVPVQSPIYIPVSFSFGGGK
jgi:LEA14-like dessication related protein